jgi:hypothetical protein
MTLQLRTTSHRAIDQRWVTEKTWRALEWAELLESSATDMMA